MDELNEYLKRLNELMRTIDPLGEAMKRVGGLEHHKALLGREFHDYCEAVREAAGLGEAVKRAGGWERDELIRRLGGEIHEVQKRLNELTDRMQRGGVSEAVQKLGMTREQAAIADALENLRRKMVPEEMRKVGELTPEYDAAGAQALKNLLRKTVSEELRKVGEPSELSRTPEQEAARAEALRRLLRKTIPEELRRVGDLTDLRGAHHEGAYLFGAHPEGAEIRRGLDSSSAYIDLLAMSAPGEPDALPSEVREALRSVLKEEMADLRERTAKQERAARQTMWISLFVGFISGIAASMLATVLLDAIRALP